jgi:hypothetical protein
MRLACLSVEAAGRQALSLVAPLATGEELQQEVQVGSRALPGGSGGGGLASPASLSPPAPPREAVACSGPACPLQHLCSSTTPPPSTTTTIHHHPLTPTLPPQVCSVYLALPPDHPQHIERQLLQAAQLAQQQQPEAAAQLLDQLIERQLQDAASGGERFQPDPLQVAACVYALLLDSGGQGAVSSSTSSDDEGDDRRSSTGGASNSSSNSSSSSQGRESGGGGGAEGQEQRSTAATAVTTAAAAASDFLLREDLEQLVRRELARRVQGAAPDVLLPLSQPLARALGSGHFVARAFAELADANMSTAARQALEMRRWGRCRCCCCWQLAAAPWLLLDRVDLAWPGLAWQQC